MQSGKIKIADKNGIIVIKLNGYVRLTLCTAFDDFIETMFASDNFVSVAIDLSDAEGLDSTTLGLLAKIAVRARKQFNFTPIIISTDPSVTRLLSSMCFERIFDIRKKGPQSLCDYGDLPIAVSSEEDVKSRVLDAHRTLMGVSEENAECFRDLVNSLEATPAAIGS